MGRFGTLRPLHCFQRKDARLKGAPLCDDDELYTGLKRIEKRGEKAEENVIFPPFP
jgi:hypothetical protein